MKRISSFLKHSLKETLPISLFPSLVFILCYSLEASFDNLFNQQNLPSSALILVRQMKERSLQCYSSFWSFIITMCLLHLLVKFIPWISKEVSVKISQNQKHSINRTKFNSKRTPPAISLLSFLVSLVLSLCVIFRV